MYCWLVKIEKKKRFPGHQNTQKIVNAFKRKGIVWLIQMTGGEPFLSPHNVQLFQGLIKNHFVSINTNLTHKEVFRFGETIDPQRLAFIHCSYPYIGFRYV